MSGFEQILAQILSGTSDMNMAFHDVRQLLLRLGFEERVRGDHHIFTKEGIADIVNLQPKGAKAKPYQVKQVRDLIVGYKLGGTSRD